MPAIDAKEALKDFVCFRIRLKCVPLSIEVLIDCPSQETQSLKLIETCQWLVMGRRMSHLLKTGVKEIK